MAAVRRSCASTRLRSFGYTSRRATSTSSWTSTNSKPATPARQLAFLEAFIDYLLRHRSLVVYVSRDLAVLARPAIAERADERRRRMEQLLTGTDLDFNGRVRVSVAFGGLQAAISQAPRRQLRAAARSAARDRANPAAPPVAERPRHRRPFEATVPGDPKPTPPLRMSHRTPDPPGNDRAHPQPREVAHAASMPASRQTGADGPRAGWRPAPRREHVRRGPPRFVGSSFAAALRKTTSSRTTPPLVSKGEHSGRRRRRECCSRTVGSHGRPGRGSRLDVPSESARRFDLPVPGFRIRHERCRDRRFGNAGRAASLRRESPPTTTRLAPGSYSRPRGMRTSDRPLGGVALER